MNRLRNPFKRAILFGMTVVLSLGCLVGCNDNCGNGEADIDEPPIKYIKNYDNAYVWGAPDTVSVMRNVEIKTQCSFWGEEWLDNADKLECDGIKGDTEAVQVMITAKKDIDSFYLSATDLSLVNGSAVINKSCVEILAERYIEVVKPSSASNTASMFTGFYPDALVPIDAYQKRKENKITKDENQGIWVNIHIPENAEQGTYKGVLKLSLDNDEMDLPLTVKVYNVTMPQTIHATTAFDIYYNQIGLYENTELEDEDGNLIDWNQVYFDYVVSKRLSPQATYRVKSISLTTEYEKWVNETVELARNEKITSYRLAYGGSGNAELGSVVDKTKLIGLLEAMARKNIELVLGGENIDLFKKAYFYLNTIIDEPSAEKFDKVRYCDRAITEAKRTAAEVFDDYIGDYSESINNRLTALKTSLLRLPHLVTSPIDRLKGNEKDGGVQTWVCQTQDYKGQDLKSINARRQSTEKYTYGEGFWSYMTMQSNNPVPSLQLEENLLSPRSLFWMNYNYNISGFLFWCVNFYSKTKPGENSDRDVWTNPNTYLSANGDGYLLYPGSRYGLTTPMSTLRMESLRQGSEDYEYLYMLENALTDYNLAHGTSFNFAKVMTKFYKNVFKQGTMICETNINNFMTARKELLTLLEAVVNDADNAMSLLNEYQAFQ